MTGRYLQRIGYRGPVEPTAQALCELQQCHFRAVPYENMDILAGIPLSLNREALYDKVVLRGRGGYCFELNALFSDLLRAIGFAVTDCFARFLLGEPEIPKRRHHVLIATVQGGERWVADVGVGVAVPLRSVRLVEGEEQRQANGTYRFRRDDWLGWVLQDRYKGGWRDLYSFTEEPQLPVDFLTTSYFCENAPQSIFNKDIMIAIRTEGGRVTMDGDLLKRFEGERVQVSECKTPQEKQRALAEHFGIRLPAGVLEAALKRRVPQGG